MARGVYVRCVLVRVSEWCARPSLSENKKPDGFRSSGFLNCFLELARLEPGGPTLRLAC
jgi:hypothetical protein